MSVKKILKSISKRQIRFALHVFAMIVLSSSLAIAQVEKGVITGVVKDSGGAVLQSAHVSLENLATRISVQTATNGEGIYVSPPLNPGIYDVKITADGFGSFAQRVQLEVAQRM